MLKKERELLKGMIYVKKSYHTTIALLGATEFFAFFGITSFWILFLSQKGMSLWQIGLLESIFHGISLLSEVPSGMLADRFCPVC
ncbi:hypothetical protein [Streptococcus sp. X13SY08]|uniref:hypothetical protein n=1 Tax=unclassified Streptococcus TaxID=2608887 RepID=UPI000AD9125E|nr:hypothetical protein [Streptococcus sp. X13SY08]